MAKPTDTRRDLMEQEIVEAAAQQFAVRGFGATSVQHIADALGMSRSALYHYVSGKDELLRLVVADAASEVAAELESIASLDADAANRLSMALSSLITRIAASPARFRLLEVGERGLPVAVARTRNRARQRSLKALETIIGDGIATGVFRPINEHVAALAILGMTTFTAFWLPGASDIATSTIADVMAEMVLQGMVDSTDAGDGRSAPERLLERIRADLSELERVIAPT